MGNRSLFAMKILILIFIVNVANCLRTTIEGNKSRPNVFSAALCYDPNGVEGVCRNIKQCPAILNDFMRLVPMNNEPFLHYIRQSNAICHRLNQPIICCPLGNRVHKHFNRNIRGRLLTPEEGCGVGKPLPRLKSIIPGFQTEPGVYPWIALIGYDNTLKSSPECTGSLITSRHVLTSAHCINSALSFVRLGVFDLNSMRDENVQDIRVIRSERHPEFNKRDKTNNIGILYLERDVNFTDSFIRPICLPVDEPLRSRSFVDYTPFIAAWLRSPNTEKSINRSPNVMRDWQLIILRNAECKERFKRQGKLITEMQFNDDVMCAEVINDGEQMKCQSDSGIMQPIFNKKTRSFVYYQTGIPSYGNGCEASNTPTVYTRVQHFVDWIQKKIHQ